MAATKEHGNGRVAAPELAQAAGGLLSNAVNELAKRTVNAVPRADLDSRDTDYIRETLPGLWMLASLYFRADVRGLHHIQREGPVLLVGNHSGGMMAPDLFVFVLAFSTYFGVERRFFQLAHNGVVAGPTGRLVRPFGTVAADPKNAELALKSGAAVLVYPGGDYEVFRPSWDSGKVDFGGRKGFIRLALKMGVPIQPIVSIGSQETALFLSRGERLARLTRVDKILRLKTLPILFGLPFGLSSALFGHIPLPSKITIQVMPKIDLKERYGEDPDLDEIYDDVIYRMQDVLDSLAEDRRFPVLG
ncbi:MAG: 1-acyl-sn-glycerol-3-phosphate acyltransferase [Solirubrobacterales bacterium]|nr:1-acyl-sn-glycerol-3-phosphate acyltransferase [Solirubrobacterales bacterium]